MAASTSTGPSITQDVKKGEDIQEKVKQWFKDLCECWKCYKSNKEEDDPSSGSKVGSGYKKPKSDLDDPEKKGGQPSPHKQPSSGDPPPEKKQPPPPPPPVPTEPYKPQLESYGVHTLRDFPFNTSSSASYEGVYQEVLKWVKPLRYHPQLHDAFLKYIAPPKMMEKLELLSNTLQTRVNAVAAKKKVPENKHKELAPILNELSHDPGIRMDQMKSMIIVSEAFMEFPRHIVENSISLPPEKRQQLIDFICTIPTGMDRKVFTDTDRASIFLDTSLQPIMTRIGFSKPSYSSDLVWDAPEEGEEDRLGAALFLLTGTHKIY